VCEPVSAKATDPFAFNFQSTQSLTRRREAFGMRGHSNSPARLAGKSRPAHIFAAPCARCLEFGMHPGECPVILPSLPDCYPTVSPAAYSLTTYVLSWFVSAAFCLNGGQFFRRMAVLLGFRGSSPLFTPFGTMTAECPSNETWHFVCPVNAVKRSQRKNSI
jgi:hypothetical protein